MKIKRLELYYRIPFIFISIIEKTAMIQHTV